MVEPLRHDMSLCQAAEDWTGLYVVGRSHAADLAIPHLPSLWRLGNSSAEANVGVRYPDETQPTPAFFSRDLFARFSEGDVVWVDAQRGQVRGILSRTANANTLLVTERCDNLCQFCSQPPKDQSDTELYVKATLSLANFNTHAMVGITGGEPTLNRHAFVRMLESLANFGVQTPLHVLTNGRSFSDDGFLHAVQSALKGRPVLWGIPLYGHTAAVHDALVAADGAFLETVQGMSGLMAGGDAIELRIIPVRPNLVYLKQIVHFVATHLPNVTVISLMNLEPKGLARKNYQTLHVPHRAQQPHLWDAVRTAQNHGIAVRLFNYARCLLHSALRPYAVKSISDWKNYYPAACSTCAQQADCGGFFTSVTGSFLENVEPFQ